ncbi:hypothetical protein ABZ281_28145, partial [Streptomyces sp. NPDC006265]|uniref:hypothetical protein n=1 Tax=Streptomyces sp. NPDC006265 TaxID=3156740 RepID=UPI0033B0FB7F
GVNTYNVVDVQTATDVVVPDITLEGPLLGIEEEAHQRCPFGRAVAGNVCDGAIVACRGTRAPGISGGPSAGRAGARR